MINWIINILRWNDALTFERDFAISVKLTELQSEILDVNFDPFWGFLRIRLNGQLIAKDWQFFAKPLVRKYEHKLDCGSMIRIEQERPGTWNGVNEKYYRVFVNEKCIVNVQGF